MEHNRRTIEKEQEEINAYKEEIKQLKIRLEQKQDRLEERKEKIIRDANEKAQGILREAKEYADQTIKNFNKYAKSADLNKEMERDRSLLREKINQVNGSLSYKTRRPSKNLKPEDLKLGDSVKVLSLGLNGTVSTLPNHKGDLYVQMGILRSQVRCV